MHVQNVYGNKNDSQHYYAAVELTALEWNGNFHQSYREFFLSTTFFPSLFKYLIYVHAFIIRSYVHITKFVHACQIIGRIRIYHGRNFSWIVRDSLP